MLTAASPGDDRSVEEIVIADRAGALLPVLVVALAARVLTWTTPPLAIRAFAAGVVAGACWVAYRLLTARLVVRDRGLHIRGVFADRDLSWTHVTGVTVGPANSAVRFLFGAAMPAHTLLLQVGGRTLRPVACLSHPDDDELPVLTGDLLDLERTGAWAVPSQRQGPPSRVTAG